MGRRQVSYPFALITVLATPTMIWGRTVEPLEVRGVIATVEKSPIIGAKIEFTGPPGSFAAETGVDGTYNVRLPRGSYVLSASAKGFCVRSKSISVQKSVDVPASFALMNCSDCPPMNVDFAQPEIGVDGQVPQATDFSRLPSMKYETEQIGLTNLSEPKAFIMFGKRTDTGSDAIYSGLFCPGHDKPSIVTYFGTNVSAQRFAYSKFTKTLTGEGHVVVLDDSGVRMGAVVEISLDGSPVIKGLK